MLDGKQAGTVKSLGGLPVAVAAAGAAAAVPGDAAAVAALEARMGGAMGSGAAAGAGTGGPDKSPQKKAAKFSLLAVISKYETMHAKAGGADSRGSGLSGDDRAMPSPPEAAEEDGVGAGAGASGEPLGAGSGKKRKGKGEHSNDSYYDTDDSFIDDEEVYEEVDAMAMDAAVGTKYDGFFVNAGELETHVDEQRAAQLQAQAAAAAAAAMQAAKRKGGGKGGGKKKKVKVAGADGKAGVAPDAGTPKARESKLKTPWPLGPLGSQTSAGGGSAAGTPSAGGAGILSPLDATAIGLGVTLPAAARLPAPGTKMEDVRSRLEKAVEQELKRRAALPEGDKGRKKLPRAVLNLLADAGVLAAKKKLKAGRIDESAYTALMKDVETIVAPLEIQNLRRCVCASLNAIRERQSAMQKAFETTLEELREVVDERLGDVGATARARADEARAALPSSQQEDFEAADGGAAADKEAAAASRAVLEAAGKLEWIWDFEPHGRLFIQASAFVEQRCREEAELNLEKRASKAAGGAGGEDGDKASKGKVKLPDSFFLDVAKVFPPGMFDAKTLRTKLGHVKWNAKRSGKWA